MHQSDDSMCIVHKLCAEVIVDVVAFHSSCRLMSICIYIEVLNTWSAGVDKQFMRYPCHPVVCVASMH